MRIPVIEGDYELADRNAEIGYLDIKAAEIRRDLRSGADIQVIIEIDESRLIKTTAEIDDLDQEFATPLHLDKPIPDIERLQEEFTLEQKRLEDIRSKAQNTGDTHAQQILDERVTGENMVQSISSALAISSGDPDAGDNAQKRLLGLRVALDDAENYLLLPALIVETEKEIEDIRKLLSSVAADYTRRFQIGEREAKTAIQNKNIDMLKHALTNLVNLEGEILRDLPQFWVSYFNYLCDNMEKMRNQQDARALQAEGKRAIDTNNLDKLKVTVKQMLALLPIEEQKKASRGRSGVSL